MIRLPLILTAAAAAAAVAVTPAIVGLTDNPSFSERLPVHVPAHASLATFPSQSVAASSFTREREPGDDSRSDSHSRRGDDGTRREDRRPGGPTATTLPSSVSREPEPGDDGHHSGGHHGGDDGSHGGGHHGGDDG